MEIVSSPAKKLEAAMARLVLRGVFPKKDIDGDDPPVAAPVDMVIAFIIVVQGLWVSYLYVGHKLCILSLIISPSYILAALF